MGFDNYVVFFWFAFKLLSTHEGRGLYYWINLSCKIILQLICQMITSQWLRSTFHQSRKNWSMWLPSNSHQLVNTEIRFFTQGSLTIGKQTVYAIPVQIEQVAQKPFPWALEKLLDWTNSLQQRYPSIQYVTTHYL